jgi:hypothetical protein
METVFKIVEINDFKQLPHITLAFRSGSDASIKQVGMYFQDDGQVFKTSHLLFLGLVSGIQAP